MTLTHAAITGAATGMGAQLAARLRERGIRVTALDIADPTAPVDAFVRTDLADPASIAAAADAVGEVDALINCAGIPGDVAPPETVFAVNYLGLRALTDRVVQRMPEGAQVLSISSMAGHRWRDRAQAHRGLLAAGDFDSGMAYFRASDALQERPVYGISKEAVWAYTGVLAAKLLPRRIRVNSVAPGLVDTKLLQNFVGAMSEQAKQGMTDLIGGPIQPADVAGIMGFLLSDQAHWINAQNLVVDGGYLAGMEFASWES